MVEMLWDDLGEWLRAYTYERPRQGCRNPGRRPIRTIKQCLEGGKEESWEYRSLPENPQLAGNCPSGNQEGRIDEGG